MNLFEPFPKLARLSRECVVTEKLDGTNAQIYIVDPETLEGEEYEACMQTPPVEGVHNLLIYAGSRTRLIQPGKTTDNYGFAQWVRENADELVKLGEGRHFGEWWGKGIQRGYGLQDRRFSLFHTYGVEELPACVSVVPELDRCKLDDIVQGGFNADSIFTDILERLKKTGSVAAPGFMNPEGIVVYHTHAKVAFKKTFDDKHKEAA